MALGSLEFINPILGAASAISFMIVAIVAKVLHNKIKTTKESEDAGADPAPASVATDDAGVGSEGVAAGVGAPAVAPVATAAAVPATGAATEDAADPVATAAEGAPPAVPVATADAGVGTPAVTPVADTGAGVGAPTAPAATPVVDPAERDAFDPVGFSEFCEHNFKTPTDIYREKEPFKAYIRKFKTDLKNSETKEIFLNKVLIPNAVRREYLKSVFLYPDLRFISRYCEELQDVFTYQDFIKNLVEVFCNQFKDQYNETIYTQAQKFEESLRTLSTPTDKNIDVSLQPEDFTTEIMKEIFDTQKFIILNLGTEKIQFDFYKKIQATSNIKGYGIWPLRFMGYLEKFQSMQTNRECLLLFIKKRFSRAYNAYIKHQKKYNELYDIKRRSIPENRDLLKCQIAMVRIEETHKSKFNDIIDRRIEVLTDILKA